MVLDLNLKRKTLRRLVYLVGAFIELIGLALLFNFNSTMSIIHSYPILFSLILSAGGYIVAVGGRRIR